MADEIVYTANASQAFDVIARLQAQVNSLDAKLGTTGRGGDHIGEGFLRSERIVSRSAANMASSLLTINDPLNAIATSLLSFEHATKLGLGLAVGLAVGIAAFEVIHKQLEETRKAREALDKDISKPIALIINLNPADISAQIDRVGKEVEDLRKKNGSFSNIAARQVLTAFQFGAPGTDQNQVEISKGEDRLKALADARADAELRITAQKEHQITLGAEEAAGEKATNDYLASRSKLFDGAFKPGASQVDLFKQLAAIDSARRQAKDAAGEKGAFSDTEFASKQAIANFRGGSEAKKDFNLDETLKQDVALLGIAEKYHDIDEVKKLSLKVDQDQLALDDRRLEKAKQQLDLTANAQDAGIKSGFARAGVGLGSEGRAALGQDEAVALAARKVQTARDLVALDATDVNYQKQLTTALSEQSIALANKAKFQNDKTFKDSQELKGAKAATQEASLQSQGQNFQASILKAREAAEQRIAALLHDQKGALAGQAAEAAKIGITKQLGDRLAETPAEQNARENAEREQARRTANAQAAIQDAADRESRGAILDENNPVTQALRAAQGVDNGLAGKDQAGDFSSVASLAGQDFSSLASLGSLDFSGIATLAGLSISIA